MLRWADEVVLVPLAISTGVKIRAKAAPLMLSAADAEFFRSSDFDRQARAAIERIGPDVVLVQFPQMAQYRAVASDRAIVLDVQDAFSVSQWRRVLSGGGAIDRLIRTLGWWGWVRYERRHYPGYDVLMTLSEQDRQGLTLFTPQLAPVVIPPLVPMAAYEPQAREEGVPGGDRIGFVGAFNHSPNVEAVQFLLSSIWPRVLAERPNAELHIAGRGLAPDVVRGAQRVTYHGFVDDLSGFLRMVDVVLAPLRSGGGVKIKVLEAMAAGRPVVATSIGAEGIAGEDGVHFIVRDTPAQITAAVLDLLADDAARTSIGINAAALVRDLYSQGALLERVEVALHLAAERAAIRR